MLNTVIENIELVIGAIVAIIAGVVTVINKWSDIKLWASRFSQNKSSITLETVENNDTTIQKLTDRVDSTYQKLLEISDANIELQRANLDLKSRLLQQEQKTKDLETAQARMIEKIKDNCSLKCLEL